MGRGLRFHSCFQSGMAPGDQLYFQPHLSMWAACWFLGTPRYCEVMLGQLRAHWERGCYGRPCPSLHTFLNDDTLLLWQAQATSAYHPPPLPPTQLQSHHTPAPSSCLLTANHSPLSRSVLQSLSFSTQPPCAPADMHLRLRSAGLWHRQSVQAPLCSVLPAANHLLNSSPSLWSSLSISADLPAGEGASQGAGIFSLSQLPPRVTGSIPIPPAFFSFVLPNYVEIFPANLGVWDILPTFIKYSVRIVPHVEVFVTYLLEEVSFTSSFSAIFIGVPFNELLLPATALIIGVN